MAIGIIATLKVQPGKGPDVEAVFRDLAAQVRASEPANTLYTLCKSRTDPETYVVMEMYDDEAAVEAHRNSDHYRAAGPKLAPFMAGRPDIQLLDSV